MDRVENTVPLLLFNFCLADWAENTIPVLLFAGRCLATADCFDYTVLVSSEYATIWLLGMQSGDEFASSADI
jgi:hypothetical protein